MDPNNPERSGEQKAAEETPEDVAVLYSWANLQGAKYRDFSASRREFRAQMKHRAAEVARETEEKAKADAEEAARREEESAQRLIQEAADAEEAQRATAAAEAARQAEKAAQDRLEAARHAEAAAAAEAAARRAAREAAEAHAHAEMQQQRWEGHQAQPVVPGEISDPYLKPSHDVEIEHHIHRPHTSSGDRAAALRQSSAIRAAVRVQPGFSSGMKKVPIVDPVTPREPKFTAGEPPAPQEPPRRGYHPDVPTAQMDAYREEPRYEAPARNFIPAPERPLQPYDDRPAVLHRHLDVVDAPVEPVRNFIPPPPAVQQHEVMIPPVHETPVRNYVQPQERMEAIPEKHEPAPPMYRPAPIRQSAVVPAAQREPQPVRPAWLYGDDRGARPQPALPEQAPLQVPDTLQHSRERVASRWFALKGVFDHTQEQVEPQPVRKQEYRIPTLVVFSLAGGVGKTSMVATLGRALSSMGEKVLLTDTTSHGLLPFYFGARELRPGVVRTFSPPPGSTDAPIYLVNYELDQKSNDQGTQEWVMDEIARNGQGAHRMVVDLSSGSGWLLRRLARLNPTVVVPVAPDMNSVISLQAVEKFFHGITDADGRPIRPSYVLNQFDASLPLHLDVREVMRQLVGDRLLPFSIRRNPAVSEALAEGMTVIDYAPSSPVSEDFLNVATWVRAATAPATAGFRGARWTER
ncbi:cellulose synthase operon protein YhjQ/BcsQ [Terriglobus tenax]|uniref:cellulose synthase operon protein YhjQ/BcsQ n=1 Tax=Terriglobus tenax TaxID=1111115 RepID=UPI0021E01971|nr:cellulose synthase operon protein YhjQ/BcsQ [Terriglobus tenax]